MNKLIVLDNANVVCAVVAERIVELSKKYIAENGRFSIALSGGNTPKTLFSFLSRKEYAERIDWRKTLVFWSDERDLPATDANNNSNMAFTWLLNNVPIPAENIFPVPVHEGAVAAAEAYEKTIQQVFRKEQPDFDLILLGLGENGHTASLFPHSSILTEDHKLVAGIFVEEVNMYRISFTAKLINQAKQIFFLVTGKEKSSILCTIFTGSRQPFNYPAQLIQPVHGELYWYADKAAASSLKNT